MKLKAVEMHGFKSFPNKTRIDFGEGITAIIGPNGSGKSNVSDSVRWVLGEMSMKSLRGSRMEDIIFNGAAGVAQSGSASVSLILDTTEEYMANKDKNQDNENQNLKLGHAPETIIKRSYYRNGDSEYYINKKQVRLRDIYEMFYDTGIGREGYSVIGQGKISEVLSQKDEDRRRIFEEAAGISGFRYKKLEAERKLKETEQNLLRLDDIVGEISSRLKPLEKDAENARVYLDLSTEKKGLEVTLWLDKLDSLKFRLGENKKETAIAKENSERLDLEALNLEQELDKAINETYEISKDTAENERLIAEKKQNILTLEGESAVLVNEISHLEREADESSTRAKVESEYAKSNSSELISHQQKLESAKLELENKQKQYNELMQRYTDERSALSVLIEKRDLLSVEREEILNTISQKRIDLASKTAQNSAFADRLNAVKKSLADADARYLMLEQAKTKAQRDKEKAVEEKSQKQNLVSEINNNIISLSNESEELRTSEDKLKLELTAKEQRRDGLERLERLFEGYSDSVKSLMNAVRNFEIRNMVYGTVSSVISVDGEYTAAVECALGGAIQYIIVGDEGDAKSCIDYLKRTRSGRATFLPLTSVRGSRADVSRIKNMQGYVGIASDIVKTEKKFRGIADDLLGRTIVVDNMDNAVEIAKAVSYRLRIVTKDAQLIQAGGHFTGGSALRRTGILTRTLDIERLSGEIKDIGESLLEIQVQRNNKDRELQRKKETLEEYRQELTELERAAASRESEYSATISALVDAKDTIIALKAELREMSEGEDFAKTEIETLKNDLEKSERNLTNIDEKLSEINKEVGHRNEADRSLIDEVGEYRLSLAAMQNEVDRISEIVERTKQAMDEAELRALESDKQHHNALEKSVIAAKRIKELQIEIERSKNEANELSRKLLEYAEKQNAAQQKINELRSESKAKTTEKESAFREYTELNSKAENWNKDYEQFMEKLWDEYELTYSEADEIRLPAEKMDKAPSRLASIKSKIRSLGSINVNAMDEFKETKKRYDFLTEQIDDLNKTKRSLDGTIDRLEKNMQEIFLETFDKINMNFGDVFTELFGGGKAYVELSDRDNPLECGIDIIVKPPGKTVKNISLLSGGEQSFAAIALYLSLQRISPAPFCIFDEIDTALDEVNVGKLADFVRRNTGTTQYIFITHRRGTMERANTLYGIMMPHKGVSEYLKLDLSKLQAKEQAEFEVR